MVVRRTSARFSKSSSAVDLTRISGDSSSPCGATSETELADHFESLSVTPHSSPKSIRRSVRVASRSSSNVSTPCKKVKTSLGKRALRTRKSVPKKRRQRKEEEDVQSLPGREQEFELLTERISDAIKTQQGCCICNFILSRVKYICNILSLDVSGVPGTGKTATVRQAVKHLEARLREKFDFFELNGMKLAETSQTYSELWKHVSGRSLSGSVALRRLSTFFEKGKHSPLYKYMFLKSV